MLFRSPAALAVLMLGVLATAIGTTRRIVLKRGWAEYPIVWVLLGLHTTHIVTDFLDTAVLTILMFVGPIEEKRFVDVEENAAYWYFVVIAWLPIYGVIYWAPRVM